MMTILIALSLCAALILLDWTVSYVRGPLDIIYYPPLIRNFGPFLLISAIAAVPLLTWALIVNMESVRSAAVILMLTFVVSSTLTIWLVNSCMSYEDRSGELFSSRGLRFGGIRVEEFTELVPDHFDRLRIIADSHYLTMSPHALSEFLFLLTFAVTESLQYALTAFCIAIIGSYFGIYFSASDFRLRQSIAITRNWSRITLVISALMIWHYFDTTYLIVLALFAFAIAQQMFGVLNFLFLFPLRWITRVMSTWTILPENRKVLNYEALSIVKAIRLFYERRGTGA